MNKLSFITSTLALIMVLSVAGLSAAGDSASISVSCSIPVMPGLNAPLIEDNSLKTSTDMAVEQKNKLQESTQQQSPQLLQEDTYGEKIIGQAQKTTLAVKTIYSR